jgi:hypothetical protein
MLTISPGSAHTGFVGSNPPDGAMLEDAPREVRLEFSEEMDPALTQSLCSWTTTTPLYWVATDCGARPRPPLLPWRALSCAASAVRACQRPWRWWRSGPWR